MKTSMRVKKTEILASLLLLLTTTTSARQSNAEKATEVNTKQVQAQSTDELVLVDVVVMNPGHTLAEREAYEAAVLPIAEKYDMEKTDSYEVVQHLNGKAKDAIKVNLWDLPSPQAMKQLNQDPEYQALESERQKLHNFNQLTLYTAKPVQDAAEEDGDLILVDMVVMNPGFGIEEREEYEAKVLPIAARYGMERTHSYKTADYLNGSIEDVVKVNLWRLPDAEAMEKLNQDPEYQALEAERNRLHNFNELTLYLAKPTEQTNLQYQSRFYRLP